MNQQAKVQNYYKFQAPLYDWTRWSFLFGRKRLPEWIRQERTPKRILEIGCGTGANLAVLARAFPESDLTGVDLSEPMLQKAHTHLRRFAGNRIKLLKAPFEAKLFHKEECFDLILCSYSLSMMDDFRSKCIAEVGQCLCPDGLFMVLDFLDTPYDWFRDWMDINHVKLDPQLFNECVSQHQPLRFHKFKAYAGLWSYFVFIGKPLSKNAIPPEPSKQLNLIS